MAKLEDLRKEIDRIDAEIVKLYEERMDICGKVAEYKIETGSRVFDKERENEKLAAVEEKVKTDSYKTGARELFQQLMSMSRKLQYQLLTEKGTLGKLPFIEIDKLNVEGARIVFQGTEGAYSQAAMQKYFGEDINSFHVSTFKDAMAAIEEGSADFAVLPIENSSAGAVDQVYGIGRAHV